MTTTIKVTDSAGHVTTQTIDLVVDTTPPTTAGLAVGVYSSGNNSTTEAYLSQYGAKTGISSYYIQWRGAIPTHAKTVAAQGKTIVAAMMTKVSSGVWVKWTDIAKGDEDAQIIKTVKALDALGVPVLLTLDCEPDAQWDASTGAGGGSVGVAPGQTPEQYVEAFNHFADVVHANSNRVKTHMWFAGFKSATETRRFLPEKTKLDNIGWDPYKTKGHPTTQTPSQLFAVFINNVLVPAGYDKITRHINETGIQIELSPFTVQQQKDFYTALPQAMTDNNIQSVIWFRADSGNHHYIPTDPSVDQAFATMSKTIK